MENTSSQENTRKELLRIFDNGGTIYDMIELLNTKSINNDGDNFLALIYNSIAVCVNNGYRSMCTNKKLDNLFDIYKESSLARLRRGAYISSCKYYHP